MENREEGEELRPIIVWIPVEKVDPIDHDDNGDEMEKLWMDPSD